MLKKSAITLMLISCVNIANSNVESLYVNDLVTEGHAEITYQSHIPYKFYVTAMVGQSKNITSYTDDVTEDGNISSTIGFGYEYYYGKHSDWSNVFINASINYYYMGKAFNQETTNIDYLNAIDGEISIGTYIQSPLSIEVGAGIGGSLASPQSDYSMGLLTFKIGYDISDNTKILAQYINAGFGQAAFIKSRAIKTQSAMVGIQYNF